MRYDPRRNNRMERRKSFAPAVKPPFPRELAKLLDGGGVLVAPFGFMRFLVCEGVWLIGCISWFRDLVFWSASL